MIARVAYLTDAKRINQLETQFAEWVKITQRARLPDARLYLAAYAIFDFVKTLALCTKHTGFSEEREWRALYVPERDPLGYLKSRLDYFVGPRGVEPKLKYKFGQTYPPQAADSGAEPLTTGALTDILEFILLGPTVSSPLAKSAFCRMLERNSKSEFANRVFPSTIPLRPQN
jgi:hypothetical protein